MREHMPSDARIHYALLDAGGVAPNVVQAFAKVRYSIRARDLAGMNALIERVRKVADGAALMTETKVEAKVASAVSNLLGNTPLEQAMQRQLDRLGPPPFDAADRKYAAEIQATLSSEDIASAYARAGVPFKRATPLCDFIVPYGTRGAPMMGSTDVGDVSWVVPTVQARVATHAIGTPEHSWQITAQGKSGQAKKGMVHAAKVMAGVAVDALGDPALIFSAKADLSTIARCRRTLSRRSSRGPRAQRARTRAHEIDARAVSGIPVGWRGLRLAESVPMNARARLSSWR
jgi:aminobenzoyl-glutamate utilization protein B